MTSEAYKKLSIKEFDHVAEKFDGSDPSIYNMCRKDYPDILEEIQKETYESLLDAGCGTGAAKIFHLKTIVLMLLLVR